MYTPAEDDIRVAAYQAPLLAPGSMDVLDSVRMQVKRCESEGVTILCCPEAILGGLADNYQHPLHLAIATEAGVLRSYCRLWPATLLAA